MEELEFVVAQKYVLRVKVSSVSMLDMLEDSLRPEMTGDRQFMVDAYDLAETCDNAEDETELTEVLQRINDAAARCDCEDIWVRS